MPSGMTSKIYEGKEETLESYILKCAHQFGGLMHTRDDGFDAPVRLRESYTSYYDRKIKSLREELTRYQQMTLDDAKKQIQEHYEEELTRYNRRVKEKLEVKERYTTMLEKVQAWEPPTDEHLSLKNDAVKQLEDSIHFDCSTAYMSVPKKPLEGEAQQWLENQKYRLVEQIQSYKDDKQSDQEKVASNNKWIKDLLDSLGGK
jgi:gas vesicle protein